MSEEQKARGGFLGFLTTIPGILTAVAALVTAVGGIYLGLHRDGLPSPQSPPPPAVTTINLHMDGGNTPTPSTDVDAGSLRLDDSFVTSSTDPVEQLIGRCGRGDDNACIEILDEFARGCADGNGLDCDTLFEISPVGSDYELFGATCGDRFTAVYADTCSEQ
jgi:hypothetical protein